MLPNLLVTEPKAEAYFIQKMNKKMDKAYLTSYMKK
jgi:hypothetical protein